MQSQQPSMKRTREKHDAGELRSPRSTKPSPAAHQDVSGILKVPPAGKNSDPPRAPLYWQNVNTTDLHSQDSLGSWALPPGHGTEPWLRLPSAVRGVQEHQPRPRNQPDPIFKAEKQVSTDNS